MPQTTGRPETADVVTATTSSPSVETRMPRDDGDIVVSVRGLEKTFHRQDGSIVRAVDHVDLDVQRGEFIVLLGPSGCGKTTLLRCIAGLERPSTGSISIHGQTVYDSSQGLDAPPQKRLISMIFQSYALWPHMTAFENVAYPLRSRKVSKAEIPGRVERALEMVGIPELKGSHPAQMSGGQQQRVALARALVSGDNLILFDEPLSNVDAKVREQLRLELLSMQRDLGFSALYVTHDQVEAMELAHRIAVMQTGQVAQLGRPREVYEQPTSRYVANFIGTANEIRGTVASRHADDVVEVETPLGQVRAVAATPEIGESDEVSLVFRPERCHVEGVDDGKDFTSSSGQNVWEAEVVASLFVGSHTEHVLRVGDARFRIWLVDTGLLDEGSRVRLMVATRDVRAVAADA